MKDKIKLHFAYLILFAVGLFGITGCAGYAAKADLTTTIDWMGTGEHRLVLAVPVGNSSNLKLFDNLPDFGLITGVSVKDYRTPTDQGIEVRQSFWSLWQLNGDPKSAHFINTALQGSPVAINVNWTPGIFTRQLEIKILVNSKPGNSIQDQFALASLSLFTISYAVDLPGKIIRSNGELVDDHTVRWKIVPGSTQMLEATSEVLYTPMLLALFFSSGAVLLVVLLQFGSAQFRSGKSGKTHGEFTHLGSQKPPVRRLSPPRR